VPTTRRTSQHQHQNRRIRTKKAEQGDSENDEQNPSTASDGLITKVSADTAQNKSSSSPSSSPAGQDKNVTQNLSQEIQSKIEDLSTENEDDKNSHDSHDSNKKDSEIDVFSHDSHDSNKKDDDKDNQDTATSPKPDLEDLHKLKSFLYEELK